MLSMGIIWNPAFKYKDDIISDMDTRVKVVEFFDVNFEELFKDFIYELYIDEEQWKTDRKYNSMKLKNNNEDQIRIVFFEFDEKNIEFHPQKKKNVYSDLNDLKICIRNKYGQKINNYVFDNVFHSTDDLNELKKAQEVLKKYLRLLLTNKLKNILEMEKRKNYVR